MDANNNKDNLKTPAESDGEGKQEPGNTSSESIANPEENPPREIAETPEEQRESAQLEAQGKQVDVNKRKRGNRWGFILTVAIFVCVVIVLWQFAGTIENHDTATFADLLAGMNGWYLLAAFGLIAFVMICDVLKYVLLNRTFGCSVGLARAAKLGLTGKYYECITPTATGGQPMQILYLHSCGVSGGKSSSVVMMKYNVQMLAAAIVGAIVMGVWGRLLFEVIPDGTISVGIYAAGWVGFSINACAPVFLTIVIFCPKLLKKITNWILLFLRKIHIVKKYEERKARIYRAIDDFAVCSQFIFKHPLKFLQLLGLCFVEPAALCIIPYFVFTALCGGQIQGAENLFFTVAALSTYSTYAAVYIPTPGNSGAVEMVFMLAFAALSGDVLFWVILVWRFVTFYIYIVMGIGMNLHDLVRGIVKRRREAKAEAPADSIPPSEKKDE